MSGRDNNSGGEKGEKRPRHGGGRGGGGRGGREHRHNPRRGGPGVLLTCETGREGKCLREGLDILRHYYYNSLTEDGGREHTGKSGGCGAVVVECDKNASWKPPGGGGEDSQELSLEEEIAMLRGGASVDEVLRQDGGGHNSRGSASAGWGGVVRGKSPFAVYDTGCKGTVFIMCTLPNCNLIPAVRPGKAGVGGKDEGEGEGDNESKENVYERRNESDEDEEDRPIKRRKIGGDDAGMHNKTNDPDGEEATPIPWDPIGTVRRIFDGIIKDADGSVANSMANDAPSSRFVTRMIPVQATCFASMEEIRPVARALTENYLLRDITAASGREQKKMVTFEVAFKKRNCSHLRRGEVIGAVTEIISELTSVGEGKSRDDEDRKKGRKGGIPKLAVDLTNPDYTIQVEICKTLCGMSVVSNSRSLRNYNLFEIRQMHKQSD